MICFGQSAVGQYIEDDSRTATDVANGNVFIGNPAAIFPGKTWITYQNSKSINKYTAITNDNGPVQADASLTTTYHGLGISYPLGGGAAVGLTGQQIGKDTEVRVDNRNNLFEESMRTKNFSGKFIIDLTPKLRGGIAYKITEERMDVLGNFFIDEDDRTKYLGSMTGYSLGFFYDMSNGGFGLGHSPGMRGKAEVQGEEKIVSQRGYTVLDFYRESNKRRFGLVYKVWQYKRDDRAEIVQSFVDQRNMSLNGIDLEQFLFDTELVMLGLDWPVNNDTYFIASAGRYKGVFLFDGEVVPGDDQDNEFPLTSITYKAGFSYIKNDFKLTAIYSIWNKELENFQDRSFWLSARQYDSYESKQTNLTFSISFVK